MVISEDSVNQDLVEYDRKEKHGNDGVEEVSNMKKCKAGKIKEEEEEVSGSKKTGIPVHDSILSDDVSALEHHLSTLNLTTESSNNKTTTTSNSSSSTTSKSTPTATPTSTTTSSLSAAARPLTASFIRSVAHNAHGMVACDLLQVVKESFFISLDRHLAVVNPQIVSEVKTISSKSDNNNSSSSNKNHYNSSSSNNNHNNSSSSSMGRMVNNDAPSSSTMKSSKQDSSEGVSRVKLESTPSDRANSSDRNDRVNDKIGDDNVYDIDDDNDNDDDDFDKNRCNSDVHDREDDRGSIIKSRGKNTEERGRGRESVRQGERESGRESTRESVREREGGRESRREGVRQGARERGRESGRERERERGRESSMKKTLSFDAANQLKDVESDELFRPTNLLSDYDEENDDIDDDNVHLDGEDGNEIERIQEMSMGNMAVKEDADNTAKEQETINSHFVNNVVSMSLPNVPNQKIIENKGKSVNFLGIDNTLGNNDGIKNERENSSKNKNEKGDKRVILNDVISPYDPRILLEEDVLLAVTRISPSALRCVR